MQAHHGMSPLEHVPGDGEGKHELGARVLVFDAFLAPDHEAVEALELRGYAVVRCGDHHALLEEIVQRPPAVVVFGLCPDGAEELGLLHLVRRALPSVPLILVADKGSLQTQRLVQGLRPVYYGVCPLETDELAEAVAGALDRPRRHAAPNGRWMVSPRSLVGRARLR